MTEIPNIFRLCGSSESSCGYCQGKRSHLVGKTRDDSSKSYGLLVERISADDYELLMNRGWRRSGLHLYKPDNWDSCCPALSIRLEVENFSISKSQKRVRRNMQRCLQNEHAAKPQHRKVARPLSREEQVVHDSGLLKHIQQIVFKALSKYDSQLMESMCLIKFQNAKRSGHHDVVVLFTTACAAVAGRSKGRLKRNELSTELMENISKQLSAMTWPYAFELICVDRHDESGHVFVRVKVPPDNTTIMTNASLQEQEMKDVAQSHDLFGEWLGPAKARSPYKLKITSVPAGESALQPEVHRLYALYQHKIHGDPDPFSSVNQNGNDDEWEEEEWDGDNPQLERAAHMLRQEYAGKSDFQMGRIQKSFLSFYRFLVESPLPSAKSQRGRTSPGTYHQQYRVEGQLIAVGVVDVLPTGLSSVYAFYHPSLSRHLALGKFTTLKEIEWTQQAGLPYYYLGYYIESCTKMKYKAEYKPSEILCPTHLKWVSAARAAQIIQRDSPVKNCCTLYEGTDHEETQNVDCGELCLDVGLQSTVSLQQLNTHGQALVRPLLEEFLNEMSCAVSTRCIIKLV